MPHGCPYIPVAVTAAEYLGPLLLYKRCKIKKKKKKKKLLFKRTRTGKNVITRRVNENDIIIIISILFNGSPARVGD
jgi:hypothetical protein